MSILIATQTYHPTMNGQGAFTVRLAQSLVQAGHQVDVLMPSERGQAYRRESEGVRLHALSAIPLKPFDDQVHLTLFPGAKIGQLLDELDPQVIHVQDHYPLCRAVVFQAVRRRLPLVGTNHFLPDNLIPYLPILPYFAWGRNFLDRILWKTLMGVFNRLDQAVSPTETAADILRRHGLMIPVRAISCGVKVERFELPADFDRNAFRNHYGLNRFAKLFLYVGRVDKEKQLELCLEAVTKLKRPDIQIAIAGRGNHLAALKDQAMRQGLDGRIVFTGFVPSEDLPGLLHSADVFVNPSPNELQSIATLEALSAGLPVLAAEARALPELVSPNVNGYLFQPGEPEDLADYIKVLADHPEHWKAMGQASLSLAHRHRFEYSLQSYEALYHELNPSIELIINEGLEITQESIHERIF